MPDRMNMTYAWAAWFDWVSIQYAGTLPQTERYITQDMISGP